MADQVLEWATNDILSAARLNKLEVTRVKVQSATAADVGLTIYHRDAADTANLFELRDQSAVLLSSFDDAGDLVLGGASAAPVSAGLDLQSTTRAILLNRLTTTQRDALTAVSGMLVYNATLGQFQGYHASSWLTVGKQDLGADLGDTTVSNPGSTILLTATDGIRTTGDDTLNKVTFDLNGAVISSTGILPDTDANDLGTALKRWDLFAQDISAYLAAGDAQPFFKVTGGKLQFGAGGAIVADVFLKRVSANILELESGDSFALRTDGSTGAILLGVNTDVALFRGAADRLDLASGDSFNVVNGSILTGTDAADLGTAAARWDLFSSDVRLYNAASDANPSVRLNALSILFGPGGATAPDVSLSRGAADRLDLATGDSFYVVDGNVGLAAAPIPGARLLISPITSLTGSAIGVVAGILKQAGTLNFVTTAQTGDVHHAQIGVLSFTSTPASTIIPNAASLRIVGPPSASGNASITNPYAFWIDAGVSRFDGNLDFSTADATNLVLGTGTGTKFGTATNQKIGFYGNTPVVRPAAYTQTFATATRTHAARIGTALTTFGTSADRTLVDVTTVAVADPTKVNANFDDVGDAINDVIVDVANTAQLLNSIIDDLQSQGLLQ